jgi:hypothetical protein
MNVNMDNITTQRSGKHCQRVKKYDAKKTVSGKLQINDAGGPHITQVFIELYVENII